MKGNDRQDTQHHSEAFRRCIDMEDDSEHELA